MHTRGFLHPKNKTPVYVGKCKFEDGHNTIKKTVASRFERRPVSHPDPNDPSATILTEEIVYIEPPEEIEQIFWKTIKPVGEPPTSGTAPSGEEGTGEDLLWIYDAKTNELVTQPTKHTGNWHLSPGGMTLRNVEIGSGS